MERMVALLRAVNVGRRKVAMSELRALAAELGLERVASYIQSGNLVFSTGLAKAEVEKKLADAIEARFGFVVAVIARTRAEWDAYAAGSPFSEAEESQANLLMLVVGDGPAKPQAAEALQERATAGERVRAKGDALWVHYPGGVAASKLTPAMFDRSFEGGAATARNWRTVGMLATMLAA